MVQLLKGSLQQYAIERSLGRLDEIVAHVELIETLEFLVWSYLC